MAEAHSWTIEGSGGEPIRGDMHAPAVDPPRGVILIAHGFKGYKDYGMFPVIAGAAADAGFIAHRFNFSHSGMTNNIDTFERPDLFEKDTWNRQVHDYRAVIDALKRGDLSHGANDLPYFLFGHSRGGASAILTAGRFADDDDMLQPAGVITAASPATCWSMGDDAAALLKAQGFLESTSSRTGQTLRVGRAYLDEIEADPIAHDVCRQIARIKCPVLIIHGSEDPTVPADAAATLVQAAGPHARKVIIDGADHVFNTPNPAPLNQPPSPQLQRLIDEMLGFAAVCAGTRAAD